MSCNGCSFKEDIKLDTYDWLSDLPDTSNTSDLVEVRFKNTRKEFYRNLSKIALKRGDMVVVEGNPGHDTGKVSLTGRLAQMQYDRKIKNKKQYQTPKILRIARSRDLELLEGARAKELQTMVRARQIANNLNLNMKIGDVEYQGDQKKAIFYYIADGRVDFRELIKHYAREFSIRIEMKQIGARQEAGRIGGIGSCGRELCCSSWRTNLTSITSNMARQQQLPESSQKLMGMCGKLKCCLMYELDTYLEAWEEFPKELLELETQKGIAKRIKVDPLKRTITYIYAEEKSPMFATISVDRVKEIIHMNKRENKPYDLENNESPGAIVDSDLTRFDQKKKRKKRHAKKKYFRK